MSTRVYVSSSAQRLIEDKKIPNAVLTGMVKGFKSEEQLIENVFEDTTKSIGIKAGQMYQWAKKYYNHGVPGIDIKQLYSFDEVIKGTINAIEGKDTTFLYIKHGYMNNLHWGWKTVVDTYQYKYLNNELVTLSAEKGNTVYLKDLVVVTKSTVLQEYEKSRLEQWGVSPLAGKTISRGENKFTTFSPVVVDPSSEDHFLLTYVWKEKVTTQVGKKLVSSWVNHEESVTIPYPEIDPEADYYQVCYTYGDGSNGLLNQNITYYKDGDFTQPYHPPAKDSDIRYFTYALGSGTYPELDKYGAVEYNELGSFYPFGYFRKKYKSVITDPPSQEMKDQIRMFKYINLDYETLCKQINDQKGIGDVLSSELMFSVPINSTDPVVLDYLFRFFKGVFIKTGIGAVKRSQQGGAIKYLLSEDQEYELTNDPAAAGVTVTISDKQHKLVLKFTGIYHSTRIGNIGINGATASPDTFISVTGRDSVDKQGKDFNGDPTTYSVEVGYIAIKKQLTDKIYEEIRVYGARSASWVGDRYAGLKVDKGVMIPLDHSIVKNFPLIHRERLYAKSMYALFNYRVEVEKDDGFFSSLLQIAAIVLAVISLGEDGGFFSNLAADLAAAEGAQATLAVMAEYLAVAVATQVGMQLFVQALGKDAGMLLAVAALVAAAYGYYNDTKVFGFDANQYLTAANGLTSAVNQSYQEDLKLLKDESEQFQEQYMKEMKEIEKVSDLLDSGDSRLTALLAFNPPELAIRKFYDIKVHYGNIGTMIFDAVDSFVDNALRLPTLPQTLELNDGFSS